MKSLKAQLSIFVIIGAILLLSMILLFSLQDSSLPFFSDQKDSHKVRQFVESCLELETKEALKNIGLSAGHYYHKDMILAQSLEESLIDDRVQGFRDPGNVELPYWYYYDDSNEEFKLNIPDYDSENQYSLKNQVGRYVNENIRTCFNEFKSFKNQFTIEYEEEFEIDVEFDKDEVIANLNHDFRIIPQNNEGIEAFNRAKIVTYNTLRVPYYLARDIVASEEDSSFVEKRLIQFLGPYQDSDSRDLLPPFYDFKNEYDLKPWNLENVRFLIKNIINSNIHRIQFLNTDYETFRFEKNIESRFADQLEIIYTSDYLSDTSLIKENNPSLFKEFSNFKIRPTYEIFYPTTISVNPSLGETLLFPKSEALFNLLPLFFTEYIAVYDITQGIVFEIRDEKQRLVFRLPIEANIDYNKPLKEASGKESLEIQDESGLDSLICDPNQFISDYITLNISDPINEGKRKSSRDPKVGVEGALISFECKALSTCYIGETQLNGEFEYENTSNLKFRLPINCNPGTLEISKFGHNKLIFEDLNPQVGTPVNLGKVEMPSLKTMKLEVRMCEDRFVCGNGKTLKKSENGIVIFNHLESEELTKVVTIDSENQYNLSVELTLGEYSIEAFIFNEDGIVLPEDEVCYKDGLFDEDCETIPEVKIDTWLRASYDKEYTISKNDLLSNDVVSIKLIDFGLPSSHEDLGALDALMTSVETSSPNPIFTR